MAAVVKIVGLYGNPLTTTELTIQRYNTAIPGQRDPGLSFPNNMPTVEGTVSRSCWQFTGCQVTGGTYSQLSYWRWGTSGAEKSIWGLNNGMIQVALKDSGAPGCPFASCIPPTGIQDQFGYDIKDPDHGIPFYINETTPCADNPVTGIAWTWEDIQNLQIGIAIFEIQGSGTCTQLYAVVTYLPYPSCGVLMI